MEQIEFLITVFLLSSGVAIWLWYYYKTHNINVSINYPGYRVPKVTVEALESSIIVYFKKIENILQKKIQLTLTTTQLTFILFAVVGLLISIFYKIYINSISSKEVFRLYIIYLLSLLVLIGFVKLLIKIISKLIEISRIRIKNRVPRFKSNLEIMRKFSSSSSSRMRKFSSSIGGDIWRSSGVRSPFWGPIEIRSSRKEGILSSRPDRGHIVNSPGKQLYTLKGKAKIPVKVYENRGEHISIVLNKTSENESRSLQSFKYENNKEGKSITAQIEDDGIDSNKLKIEVQAACIEVKGESTQFQPLSSSTLSYHWNFGFPTSGNYTINFIFSNITPSGTTEIGTMEHGIKVVRLDHLTARQILILATLATALSGMVTFAVAMNKLGIF